MEEIMEERKLSQKTALLVIDVQVGLFETVMQIYKPEELLGHINLVIDLFHQRQAPVVFVHHTNERLLKKNTTPWQLHSKLHVLAWDTQISKYVSNIFEEETFLKWMLDNDIEAVVVAGIFSHGCVKSACIGALKDGLKVVLVSDAHSHFNKQGITLIEETNQILEELGVELVSTENLFDLFM